MGSTEDTMFTAGKTANESPAARINDLLDVLRDTAVELVVERDEAQGYYEAAVGELASLRAERDDLKRQNAGFKSDMQESLRFVNFGLPLILLVCMGIAFGVLIGASIFGKH